MKIAILLLAFLVFIGGLIGIYWRAHRHQDALLAARDGLLYGWIGGAIIFGIAHFVVLK